MPDRKMGAYTQVKDREPPEGKLFSMMWQWKIHVVMHLSQLMEFVT